MMTVMWGEKRVRIKMLLDSQKNGVSLRPLHCIMGQAHTQAISYLRVAAFQASLWMIVWSCKIRAGLKRPGKKREREKSMMAVYSAYG